MSGNPYLDKRKDEILLFAVYPAGGVQLMCYNLNKLLENNDLYVPSCEKYYNLTIAVPYIKKNDNLNKEPNDTINTMFPDYNNQLKGLLYILIDEQSDIEKLQKQYHNLFSDLTKKRVLQ